jgi:hypothetical protein
MNRSGMSVPQLFWPFGTLCAQPEYGCYQACALVHGHCASRVNMVRGILHGHTIEAVRRSRNELGLTTVCRKRTTSTSPNGRQRIPDTSERKSHDAARLAKRRTDGKAGRRLKLGIWYAHECRSAGAQCPFAYTTCRICTSYRRCFCLPGTARSLVCPPTSFIASSTLQTSIIQDHCYTAWIWANYTTEGCAGSRNPNTPLSTSRTMLATMPACWASRHLAALPRVTTSSIKAP